MWGPPRKQQQGRDEVPLERALKQFPVEDYLRAKGFDEEKGGEELVGTCPHCGGENKLTYNVIKGMWRCFRCEEYGTTTYAGVTKQRPIRGAGRLFNLVQWLEDITPQAAARFIREQRVVGSTAIRRPKVAQVKDRPSGPPPGLVWCPPTLPYLARRGILPEHVREFGLGYCEWGKYAERLVFPVWWDGTIWYYQARATWEEYEHNDELRGKYIKSLNPPRMDRQVSAEDVLFNVQQAVQRARATGGRVVLTEGPIDAVKVGPEAVATFGKRLSDRQLAILIRLNVTAVDVMYDGPTEKEPNGAWPEMVAIGHRLAPFADVRLVRVPQGDPGDYSREDNARWRATSAWNLREL